MIDAPIIAVALGNITEPDEQHRERIDPEALGRLADSIAAEGLHQPIGLRPTGDVGGYEIVYGHRRFLAHRLLGRATILAHTYPADADVHLIRASENLNREQLNPVEEAHVVRLFLGRGMARSEVARQLRRSLSWIDQRAALLDLPADLLDAIREHGLSLAVAEQLKDVDHEPYRKQLIYDAVQGGTTAAVAAVWRQHYLADRERIVHNTIAIEEIIQERGKYVVKYPCDWCDEEVTYEGTRTFRLCVPCARQLVEAKRAATASAPAS